MLSNPALKEILCKIILEHLFTKLLWNMLTFALPRVVNVKQKIINLFNIKKKTFFSSYLQTDIMQACIPVLYVIVKKNLFVFTI